MTGPESEALEEVPAQEVPEQEPPGGGALEGKAPNPAASPPGRPALDHLLLATPDLDHTVRRLAADTGVRPVAGGSHPTAGTRNYLLGLGSCAYLEVIGRDPAQDVPLDALPFGLGELNGPRLVTWAMRAGDLDARVAAARSAGHDPGPIATMSRTEPDGRVVGARITPPLHGSSYRDGLLPFLLDWGGTPHPAGVLPAVPLTALTLYHPRPGPVHDALTALGALDALRALGDPPRVRPAEYPALVAVLHTPHGTLTLR